MEQIDAQRAGGTRRSWERWLGWSVSTRLNEGGGSASVKEKRTELAANGAAELVHDARNLVTAIELYCNLLAEPEVLNQRFRHYARELGMVSAASRRLLERLAATNWPAPEQRDESRQGKGLRRSGVPLERWVHSAGASILEAFPRQGLPSNSSAMRSRAARVAAEDAAKGAWWGEENAMPPLERRRRMRAFTAGEPIQDLAEELLSNRSLLAAVAGAGVTVGMEVTGGRQPVAVTREDLTRVLVNLAKNAAEAMAGCGHLEIRLEETADQLLSMSFCDTGSGIAPEAMEQIFSPGYTTHVSLEQDEAAAHTEMWPMQHRGLGLAIVRSLVTAAGGNVWAGNRSDGTGAVFTVELPVCAVSSGDS